MLKFAQDIKVFLDSLPQKFCFSATPSYTVRGNIWFFVVVAKDFLSVCTQCPRSYKKDSEDSLSHRSRSAEREREREEPSTIVSQGIRADTAHKPLV
jgi:hypothetical protein